MGNEAWDFLKRRDCILNAMYCLLGQKSVNGLLLVTPRGEHSLPLITPTGKPRTLYSMLG